MVSTHLFFSIVTVLIFSGCIDSFISEWTFKQSGFTKWDTIQEVVSFSKQRAKDQLKIQTDYSPENNVSVCNDGKDCQRGEVCRRNDDSRNDSCQCEENFARLKNGVCSECPRNCTKGERCSFGVDDIPACLCLSGYVRNGNSCQECKCNENEICSFNVDGVKVCQCSPGYVKNGEKCQECICDENEECSFRNGEKVCSCSEGYLKQNNTCIDCGCNKAWNEECFLNADNKTDCRCKKNYVSYFGGQCQECHCEDENAVCLFNDEGHKECKCLDGYIETEERCEECHCEDENAVCSFNDEGLKECKCLDGYIKTEERCEVNPGIPTTDDALLPITTDCECNKAWNEECFLNAHNKTECRCKKNYVSYLGGICQECHCKDENAVCSFNDEGLKECKCLDGYIKIEEKCEECLCKDENSVCSFDDDRLPVCSCLDGYIEIEKKCKVSPDAATTKDFGQIAITRECTCGENEECSFNMGTRSCSCKEGYLKINNICTECTCGENEECSFNMGKKNVLL